MDKLKKEVGRAVRQFGKSHPITQALIKAMRRKFAEKKPSPKYEQRVQQLNESNLTPKQLERLSRYKRKQAEGSYNKRTAQMRAKEAKQFQEARERRGNYNPPSESGGDFDSPEKMD